MTDFELWFLIFIAWNMLGFFVLCLIPYSWAAESMDDIFNPNNLKANLHPYIWVLAFHFFNLACPMLTVWYWIDLLYRVIKRRKAMLDDAND